MDHRTLIVGDDDKPGFACGNSYRKAAALVELAADGGHGLPEQVHLDDSSFERAAKFYFIFTSPWLNFLCTLNLFALIALNFLEKPLWCAQYSTESTHSCDDREYFFLGQLPYLTGAQSLVYEGITLFVLILHTFFPISFEGFHLYWKNHLNKMKVISLLILVADLSVYVLYLSPVPATSSLPLRIAPYFRVVFLVLSNRDLRACVVTLGGMWSTYINLLGLSVLFILFSSWIAFVAFEDTQQGKTTFYSYNVTFWQMFLLFTTTNNPTVWIPAYKESRFYALFFILYLLLGVYFVRNLILASVKGGFKAQLAKEVSMRDSMRKLILGKAFNLLDIYKRGFLHQDQCARLFEELKKYRSLPKISLEEYDLIFHELDDSCDLEINLDEFNNLCTAIALKFRKEDQPSWLENYPAFYHSHSSEKLKAFVRSSTFPKIITIMLMLNLVAVLIETTFDLENNSAQKIWQEVEFFFGWVYFLEMALKVFSYGFKNYWRKGQNRFDFYITWIIVIGETATFVCPGIPFLSNGEWMRYLLIARMLRLIRLLMKVQHCRVFVATFLNLIPTLMPYLGTIFCVLCIYGSLGLQVFGGIINSGNPKLKESILYDNDFLLFNFNDYPNGLVTLFTLLVGGWYTWMKGYQELTGTSWTVAYFVSFYLITVMLLFNLVVAFVLEAFNSEMNHKIQKESEDKDKESSRGRSVHHSLKPCGSRDQALIRRMVAGLLAK